MKKTLLILASCWVASCDSPPRGGVSTVDINSPAGQDNGTENTTLENEVTAANFAKLKSGISYEEAAAILGGPGKKISETEGDGVDATNYQWGVGAPVVLLTFTNGRLLSKTHVGL